MKFQKCDNFEIRFLNVSPKKDDSPGHWKDILNM